MRVRYELNRHAVSEEVAPQESLLRVLRAQGASSVKYGCDSGDCGACLVLLNGRPALSCLYPAAKVDGVTVTTVEALGHTDALHPLQRAFLERGAVQCGYCTPAMLLAAHELLQRTARPTPDEIRDALAGVLCRCTGYVKPAEAIAAAADDPETP